jgi:SAM-dependent methyltransferase
MSDPQVPSPGETLFQQQWQTYRILVDHNYLFHREAYACLHRVLLEDAPRPFRFLDLACGDASSAAQALQGTDIAHYSGIDLSAPALALAAENLASLDCPVILERRDYAEAVRDWPQHEDVVWVGLSLHHLRTPEKLEVMRSVRRIIGEHGLFLIYEDAGPDGETREEWLRRWDAQRPCWTAYDDAGWHAVTDHVHADDFPETDAGWRALGREAGFSRVTELFHGPTDLLRLYCFRA